MGGQSKSVRRRWPLGLIGALALIGAVERALARHELDLMSVYASSWRFAAEASRGRVAGAEILAIGDSQMKFGLLPGVVSGVTGRPTLNLALIGGQPANGYFLLRRALRAGARPAALVIDYKPNILAAGHRPNAEYLPEVLDAREAIDLAWSAGDPSLFGEVLVARYLPSIRYRNELRPRVLAAFRADGRATVELRSPDWVLDALANRGEAPRRATIPPHRRNWRVNAGAQAMPKNPHFNGQIPPDHLRAYFPESWACWPLNESYLHRLLDLAESRRIPVYWLLAPIIPEAAEGRRERGLDEDYAQFVRGVQRRHPGLVVLDARASGFPHTVFIDPAHLDAQGAASLSAGVADALRRSLAGERLPHWLDLPAYREPPSTLMPEDVERSRVALDALRARR